MNKHDNGEPAFPANVNHGATASGADVSWHDGMSMRDYFAAKAMPLAYQYWSQDFYNPRHPDAKIRRHPDDIFDFDSPSMDLIAVDCYEMADAMLKARKE